MTEQSLGAAVFLFHSSQNIYIASSDSLFSCFLSCKPFKRPIVYFGNVFL